MLISGSGVVVHRDLMALFEGLPSGGNALRRCYLDGGGPRGGRGCPGGWRGPPSGVVPEGGVPTEKSIRVESDTETGALVGAAQDRAS